MSDDWRLSFPEVDGEQLGDWVDEQPALKAEARPDPDEYRDPADRRRRRR